jgi:hypothetical protein
MKPLQSKGKLELELGRQLKMVRTTVRELTPTQLQDAGGGIPTECCPSCTDPWTNITDGCATQ